MKPVLTVLNPDPKLLKEAFAAVQGVYSPLPVGLRPTADGMMVTVGGKPRKPVEKPVKLVINLEEPPKPPPDPPEPVKTVEKAPPAPPKPRKQSVLEQVAEIWHEGMSHKDLLSQVTWKLSVNASTATRYIAQARDAGLIPHAPSLPLVSAPFERTKFDPDAARERAAAET